MVKTISPAYDKTINQKSFLWLGRYSNTVKCHDKNSSPLLYRGISFNNINTVITKSQIYRKVT